VAFHRSATGISCANPHATWVKSRIDKPAMRLLLLFLMMNAICAGQPQIPILVYHRIAVVRSDAMTVTTAHFREDLKMLRERGVSFIHLNDLLAWRQGRRPAPAARSVVITFDDGHLSFYREAWPILAAQRVPVTLFLYPSCISRASYAMTWAEVQEVSLNPLVCIQSHTLWHPNLNREAKRLSAAEYARFVDRQLRDSKAILESKVGHPVTMLAWPFGIVNPDLMERASAAGYEAAFTIQCRAVERTDAPLALPRCLITDENSGPRFGRFIDALLRGETP